MDEFDVGGCEGEEGEEDEGGGVEMHFVFLFFGCGGGIWGVGWFAGVGGLEEDGGLREVDGGEGDGARCAFEGKVGCVCVLEGEGEGEGGY